MDAQEVEKYKEEWGKDITARRTWHAMMNYHYLMYKGIQLLNYTYSRETLEQMGLHVHVPRTFTTIETLRAKLNRDIDIVCTTDNLKNKDRASSASHMLTGEWRRSQANNEKNSALADSFTYGSGYLLNKFVTEKEELPEILISESKKKAKLSEQTVYEGMKLKALDPYYVIPDRRAKTWEPKQANSPKHVWYYSIWDYDNWIEHAKKMDYNTEGLEKGGYLQELDYVRRYVDVIYLQNTYLNLRTRDQGTLVAGNIYELPKMDTSNAIMVLECFEPNKYTIFTGANWTVADEGENPSPKKVIPIYCVKDYEVPNELEGIGEAEVLRWQQYEENKVHNLSYLQILMNTVNRFAVVEELLKDPVEARMGNPLKNIRLKYMPNVKLSDAIQPLAGQKLEYPSQFLQEIKNIGQEATGVTDYASGSNKSQTDTLGEAELMATAGNDRTMQKIIEVENRSLTAILQSWLIEIPYFYTEELEFKLGNDAGVVKFLPIRRDQDDNAHYVAKYSVEQGAHSSEIKTVTSVFISQGYKDVVFIDDLLQRFGINIKTGLSGLLHKDLINQFSQAIAQARADNQEKVASQQPPIWDTTALVSDYLRQFDDIISDPEHYKIQVSSMQPGQASAPAQQPQGNSVQSVSPQPAQPQPAALPVGANPPQPLNIK